MLRPGRFVRCLGSIAIIFCAICSNNTEATARHRHGHGSDRHDYSYGFYVKKGLVVPIPTPRTDRVLPQEGQAMSDYLLPINRINDAFEALKTKCYLFPEVKTEVCEQEGKTP